MSHSQHDGHHMHHGEHGMSMENHAHTGSGDSGKLHHMSLSNMESGHSMAMVFHGGYVETILFEGWNTSNVGEFIGSFIAIFLMALMYEGLKYYRKHLLWNTYAGLQYCAVAPQHKTAASDDPHIIQPVGHIVERKTPTMLSVPHIWQTFLHGVQVLVSYVLMLIFMTYNTWLCLAVVGGSATGYFLFGWRESVVVDFTEHCH